MPIQAVQKLIYRNLVQRPAVNRALDSFGNRLNRLLASLGIQKRYATGLTRGKATIFASNNPAEIAKARDWLISLNRKRAHGSLAYLYRAQINTYASGIASGEIDATKKSKELLKIFPQVSEKCIESALSAKLSSDQILDLFSKTIFICGKEAKSAFQAVPAALAAGLSPDQILDLFGGISRHYQRHDIELFGDVSKALKKIQGLYAPKQIVDLFGKILDKCGHADLAFGTLPAVLATGLSLKEIPDLYGRISKKGYLYNYAFKAFSALPAALAANLSPEQIVDLFGKIVEKCGEIASWAFEALPAALAAQLSPTQIVDLFGKIVEKCGEDACVAFKELQAALDKTKNILTPAQILDLFGKIVDKCDKKAAGAFGALPAALDKAKEIFTPEQIVDLFGKIVEKRGEKANWAFSWAFIALPAALAANLSTEQIVDLLGKIVDKCGEIADWALRALPAALAANLSTEQIVDLFGKIVEKCGEIAFRAFEALPAALAANLSTEQIVDLFGKIVDKCGKKAAGAFGALPAALAANLSTEQIVDLFGKIVDKCGEKAGRAFESLPAALVANLPPEQIVDLLGKIVDKCGKKANWAFRALPAALAANLPPKQIVDLLGKIVEKCGEIAHWTFRTFSVLFAHISFRDPAEKDAAIARFLSMLDSLTDHNRERVLGLLSKNSTAETYEKIGPANFLPHFNLYMDILTHRKRLGLALLEGVLEATELGIIPNELSPEETKKINRFIDQTHSFSPVVYKVFRTEGDALLKRLCPLTRMIINDTLSAEAVAKVIKHYDKYDGLEFLYAVIQMAIPLSGASDVKKEEGKGLFERMMEAGDLRSHVPKALRGVTRAISLTGSEYALKAGEAVDLQAVGPILAGLRSDKKADQAELVAAVEEYLKVKGERSEADKEKLRQVLYRYAFQRDLLGEKVDRLGSTDYYTLRLLEEIFRDKDCLASILIRAIEGIDQSLLATAKTPLTNPDGLLKAINKMWGQEGSRDDKVKRLAAMTTRYQEEDLQKLAASGKLLPEAVPVLAELLQQENQVYLSRHKLAEELLKEPLAAIQKEKAKFELGPTPEGINLRLQMVKGIPYSLWGLNAGVCIAPDVELWKDPNFKLIAMIGKETETAVGFIHVYEVEIKGKKYWTLPGIEPSTEFIGTVDPAELYDQLMEQVVALAKIGGASAVYLPAAALIHSNRSDIQKAIKEKKYKTLTIPEVKWSRRPAYPFSEVYVVWEGNT